MLQLHHSTSSTAPLLHYTSVVVVASYCKKRARDTWEKSMHLSDLHFSPLWSRFCPVQLDAFQIRLYSLSLSLVWSTDCYCHSNTNQRKGWWLHVLENQIGLQAGRPAPLSLNNLVAACTSIGPQIWTILHATVHCLLVIMIHISLFF